MMIPIYKPYLPKLSLRYAHDAIDSTWISSSGRYIEMATERLRKLLGSKYVQLVNSGTSATHLVAKSLAYKRPEIRKIIVPNNVYVAAWNAFLYDKHFELIPIDADIETWNINVSVLHDKVHSIPEDVAVCIVHNLGNIVNVPSLRRTLKDCVYVEDNCEGFTGMYDNHHVGTMSLVSSMSFFGNKTITSGEGGAVVTNDEEIFEFVKSTQGQGQILKKKYMHDKLGYNYRMTNVQAAILLGQLEVLPEIIEKKQEIFEFYRAAFSEIEMIEIQQGDISTVPSNWMMAIRIVGNKDYENIQHFLRERGIDSRRMFYPMSTHPYLKNISDNENETVATKLSREGVVLPSFPDLTRHELQYIVNSIKEYIVNEN